MNLRILVDSERSPPKHGEIALLVAEGMPRGAVHFVRAQLQIRVPTDLHGGFKWEEVPMEFISHKIGLNVSRPKDSSGDTTVVEAVKLKQ